jgi:hypothetical protein
MPTLRPAGRLLALLERCQRPLRMADVAFGGRNQSLGVADGMAQCRVSDSGLRATDQLH